MSPTERLTLLDAMRDRYAVPFWEPDTRAAPAEEQEPRETSSDDKKALQTAPPNTLRARSRPARNLCVDDPLAAH